MKLRHLLAFVTVAELRHFGRAARRLGITQPPLSRQIRQLELELGFNLFTRHARAVELTRDGATYLDAIKPHFQGLTEAHQQAQRKARLKRGRLKIGYVSSLTYKLMPRLLETIRRTAPDIETEFFEQPTAEQCRGLRERQLDLGFVFLPITDQELKMRQLFVEPLVVMLPKSHMGGERKKVILEDLRKEPFIMCSGQPDTGFREVILKACQAEGFSPQVAHSASSMGAIAEMVAMGLGVALVPRSSADHQHRGIKYVPLAAMPLKLSIAAAWHPSGMTPLVRIFLDAAIKAASRDFPAPSLPSVKRTPEVQSVFR